MSKFTPAEIAYLQSQRLGRLATVGPDKQPHVVPTGFRYNPDLDTIDIGGHDFAKRKKFPDVRNNPHRAFVIDDIASVNPRVVLGIESRGEGGTLEAGGCEIMHQFGPEMFRIKPNKIVSWGIEGERAPGNP